ncbi:hypothetical protein FOA52_014928 [Chlamydomonas sp. UWO 241]|nr:hypothetical protein FOA52_014928 [Chlamydomonas sp. UWO 241]
MLERVAHFVLTRGEDDNVSKAALLHFLHQEYEGVDGAETLPHQFPVSMFPVATQDASASSHGVPMESPQPARSAQLLSPSGRRAMDAMHDMGGDMHDADAPNQVPQGFGMPF